MLMFRKVASSQRIPPRPIQTAHAMLEKAFGRIAGSLRGDDGEQSELINFLNGVKQGDPLSSLFFILFIADLEDFLRSNNATGHDVVTPELALNILLICFADDTTLIADDIPSAQRQLHLLSQCASLNGLEVNVGKTEWMGVGIPKSAVLTYLPVCSLFDI